MNGQVDREPVPEWARSPEAGTASQVAAQALSGEPKITPAQRKFLLDLIAERQVKTEQEGKVDLIMKCLRISEDPEEYGMSKSKASELITWYLKQPKKPKDQSQSGDALDQSQSGDALSKLPAGRYALPKTGTTEADNELRFYQVWESKDKQAKRLYVQFGPYESKLPYPAQQKIAQKILDAGVEACALRWGAEIGSCSNCGRRLTNRISRELAIGPICGGRLFGDDFKVKVKSKRAEIVARGEDPDEELE